MKARCENCRFWEYASEECRRHAPIALHWQFYGLCLALARNDAEAEEVVGDHASQVSWQRTLAHDWCGEHEPKEPA